MNLNTSIQHEGIMAWNGTAGPGIDIRHHVHFSFTFEVMQDLTNDTTFEIESAPPDATDPCIAGAFVAVPTVPRCDEPASVATSSIVLPKGTLKANVCKATIPCRPDAFVRVKGVSGDTGAVSVVAVLSGPK